MKKLTTTILLILLSATMITGCKIHIPDVQQGNIIDQAAVNQLRLGMTKKQVHEIMGASILQNAFDVNTWNYISTKQVNGGIIAEEQLLLQFKNNKLIGINGKQPPALVKGPVSL
ncbi:MAG: outer membrane protein assembly factor BamE [Gammaproteobacteria bacterium]|nr:outer membrane protein assembly factor BamE [Gammaproteobacteria bacterium]